jgi:hypothetical protein
MDDPNLALEDGYLSYDEQPAHSVYLGSFSIMSNTLSEHDFSQSGLIGPVNDVSHSTAQAFAEWYTEQQHDSEYVYRLPTEQEWEYARKMTSISFGQREHIVDWHGVYPNPPSPSDEASPSSYAGPSTGILKVVRDGSSRSPTTRHSLPLNATNAAYGPVVPPTTFRLVRAKRSAAGVATSNHSHSTGSLSQVGIIPDGVVSVGTTNVDISKLGPPETEPLFDVRMVLPVPPDSETEGTASLAGLDPATMYHSHSPGLEVMKNGDVLAVWFSSPAGHGELGNEYSINTRMVQARLRHGSDRWDVPSLFYDWKYANDQSALLWTEWGSSPAGDKDRTWFWGGGGNLHFKVAVSDDSGGTWSMHVPNITNQVGPTALASQPITTAFRIPAGVVDRRHIGSENSTGNDHNGHTDVGKAVLGYEFDSALYMGVDSAGSSSGLWKSSDNGLSWQDTHGRSVGRHTTYFTSPSSGTKASTIMAFGGKNSNIDGYMPFTSSIDGGATFVKGQKLPFPALATNQRPCVHRLNSGNLVFVGDFQTKGDGKQPAGFSPKVGETSGVYAAISRDNGTSWKIRPLPIGLPHEEDRKNFGTLGYSTVRQGKNGVIHILSTMTHPCLHYRINEAWLWAEDKERKGKGGHTKGALLPAERTQQPFTAKSRTASGGTATWSYSAGGTQGYKLEGNFVTYYPQKSSNGSPVVEYKAAYAAGIRELEELYDSNGHLLWRWVHGNAASGNVSNFTKYDTQGNVHVHSSWNNRPVARDAHLIQSNPTGFHFVGLEAEGSACKYDSNGTVTTQTYFSRGVVSDQGKAKC